MGDTPEKLTKERARQMLLQAHIQATNPQDLTDFVAPPVLLSALGGYLTTEALNLAAEWSENATAITLASDHGAKVGVAFFTVSALGFGRRALKKYKSNIMNAKQESEVIVDEFLARIPDDEADLAIDVKEEAELQPQPV